MTDRNKNILLILGFLLALVVCYQLAIAKTFALKKEYNTLKLEQQLFENTPKQIAVLNQKQVYYDSLLTRYQIDGTSIQNNLLKTINTFAGQNNLKVVNFLEPHTYSQDDVTINTYNFTLEGNYNNIVKLLHQLEQHTKFGEITHVNFKKQKNFRTGRYYLQANVLVKSF